MYFQATGLEKGRFAFVEDPSWRDASVAYPIVLTLKPSDEVRVDETSGPINDRRNHRARRERMRWQLKNVLG